MMNPFEISITVLAALSLFLFGLHSFSHEIQKLGNSYIKEILEKATQNKYKGFFWGIVGVTILQSSSAVSAITVAMVDAGLIGFFQSLGIMLGANVGTTFTAWLVALKIENLGEMVLVIGMLCIILPSALQKFGKPIFYIGLIFFSLQELGEVLKELGKSPEMIDFLSLSENIFLGIVIGIVATIIVQSSTVITGLVVILAAEGMIGINGAVAIILGSNIGTTSTALFASLGFSTNAKKSAISNMLFNTLGVIFFLPFFSFFTAFISSLPFSLPYQIALSHLIFNVIIAIIFLSILDYFKHFERKK